MSKYPGNIITTGASAGYSVAFDGTGDELSVPDNAAFNLTGDFTIEAWAYPTVRNTNNQICTQWGGPGNAPFIFKYDSNGRLVFVWTIGGGGSSTLNATSTTVLANAWSHVAVTRSGNTIRLFVNGVVDATTATTSGSITNGTNPIYIGSLGGSEYITGYLSNFRFVNGTALYTTNFTPPTQLFPVANTSLLTCNSPAIIDQSSNNFTITTIGNAAVSTLSPFSGYQAYNPALGAATPGVWTLSDALQAAATRQWNMYDPYFNYTTLKLGGNGTNGAQNNTFLDSSSNNFTITRNGGAPGMTQGSFSPFSQTGWSNYFDGSNDYLNTPVNAAFDLGTGAFTIEAWFHPIDTISDGIVAIGNGTAWGAVWIWTFGTEIRLRATASTSGADLAIGGGAFQVGAWNHVAAVRSGNDFSLYLNGNRVATGTSTTALKTSCNAAVGCLWDTSYNGFYSGYIADVRIVKGGALYSGATCTVPTAPLTTSVSAGTVSLLTCQNNRFIDNSSNAFAITANGGASVQPFGLFNPSVAYTPTTIGGSGYFDGTGDYLTAPDNTAWAYGTGAVTIEVFVYKTAAGTMAVLDMGTLSAGTLGFNIGDTTVVAYQTNSTAFTFNTTIPLNAWTHVALVRSAGSLALYVNGALINSLACTNNFASVAALTIGRNAGGGTQQWTGYLSGLRIIKGQALTTGAFTPPTSPVSTTSVGWTGANVAASITGTVSLLCNFTNAGIVDATGDNVLETVGNAQISTVQSKYGGSSMFFDGTGDSCYIPDTPNLKFSTGDFTIECWVYPTATPGGQGAQIIGRHEYGTTSEWIFQITSASKLNIYLAGTNVATSTGSISNNQWTHVACTRANGAVKLFINGVVDGTGTYASTTETGMSGPYTIASDQAADEALYTGYIQDLRITKGYARYIGNFTPPTSLLQNQ